MMARLWWDSGFDVFHSSFRGKYYSSIEKTWSWLIPIVNVRALVCLKISIPAPKPSPQKNKNKNTAPSESEDEGDASSDRWVVC